MKRREAETILAGLAGHKTPMAALAALVSLSDNARHMGYSSPAEAMVALGKHEAQAAAAPAPKPPADRGLLIAPPNGRAEVQPTHAASHIAST